MQIFSSQEKKREFLAVLLVAGIGIALSYGYIEPMLPEMSNPEDIRLLAEIIGPAGPVAVIALQFAQVLFAPLPPVTPVVSGMLYGVAKGVTYSMIGAALGSTVAILASRRYGRSFVESFLSDEAMNQFDKFTSGHGFLPFIVLFVFPGFPDDALCFIAGLTVLDWKRLAAIASLGRLPGIALLALTGSSIAEANTATVLGASAAIVAVSAFSLRYESELETLASEIEQEGLALLTTLNQFNPLT